MRTGRAVRCLVKLPGSALGELAEAGQEGVNKLGGGCRLTRAARPRIHRISCGLPCCHDHPVLGALAQNSTGLTSRIVFSADPLGFTMLIRQITIPQDTIPIVRFCIYSGCGPFTIQAATVGKSICPASHYVIRRSSWPGQGQRYLCGLIDSAILHSDSLSLPHRSSHRAITYRRDARIRLNTRACQEDGRAGFREYATKALRCWALVSWVAD